MAKEQISSMIMDGFRARNSRPNHVLDEKWMSLNLLNRLNPKERELVDQAIQDLVEEKLVTLDNRMGMFCLVLTDDGFDHIYPINESSVKEKIGNIILTTFARQNSKPNHILDQRWINQSLTKGLNPKEIDLIEASIRDLVEKGLITTDNRNDIFCLVLTEKGFDKIY